MRTRRENKNDAKRGRRGAGERRPLIERLREAHAEGRPFAVVYDSWRAPMERRADKLVADARELGWNACWSDPRLGSFGHHAEDRHYLECWAWPPEEAK